MHLRAYLGLAPVSWLQSWILMVARDCMWATAASPICARAVVGCLIWQFCRVELGSSTCELAAVLEVDGCQGLHVGDGRQPGVRQRAAALQVQGSDAAQAVQRQQAGVNEGDLPAPVQAQRPAIHELI